MFTDNPGNPEQITYLLNATLTRSLTYLALVNDSLLQPFYPEIYSLIDELIYFLSNNTRYCNLNISRIVQWIPIIRTPLGVGKYVLITDVFYNRYKLYSRYENRFPEDASYIRNILMPGVLITGIHCTCKIADK